MARKFSTLMDGMSEERRREVRERADALLLNMALRELRQSRSITQQDLAGRMGVSQAALSKMENQQDITVGTLRRILAAMNGRLKLIAEFPDGETVIDQFREHDDPREKIGRRGDEIYERKVQPACVKEDEGKYVVIDVDSEDFEVDVDELAASDRLLNRRPDAQVWLRRIGSRYARRYRQRSG